MRRSIEGVTIQEKAERVADQCRFADRCGSFQPYILAAFLKRKQLVQTEVTYTMPSSARTRCRISDGNVVRYSGAFMPPSHHQSPPASCVN